MIHNYLFRLLFDCRGKISRREFLAGLVVVGLLIFTPSSNLINLLYGLLYNNNSDWEFVNLSEKYWAIIDSYLPIRTASNPLYFIALCICIVIMIKRCRTISISPKIGVVMGIFTFSILPCLFQCISCIINFPDTENIFISQDSFLYAIIIQVICVTLGVISMVYTTFKSNSYDNNDVNIKQQDSKYSTINSLFYLGGIAILSTIIALVNQFYKFQDPKDHNIVITISLVIYIVGYLYVCIKRTIDANIKPIWIIGIFFAFCLIATGIIQALNIADSKFYVIFFSLSYLLNILLGMSILVLMALPSRKK